tara:strand:+ start:101 stop:1117 length:1017 start_codon:yes stop_codon:yes gene_type:complete
MAPSFLTANLVQALVNVLFGSSSVAAAIGLSDRVDPLSFGLLRVGFACVGIVSMAVANGDSVFARRDVLQLAAASLLLWTSEIMYVTGVQLAGSIAASIWQPSQPIMTLVITAALGTERLTLARVAGIILAFAGCAVMVLGSVSQGGGGGQTHRHAVLGNGCFFVNCLATVLYVVASQSLLTKYPPLTMASSTFLLMTLYYIVVYAGVSSFAPRATDYFCGGSACRSLEELSTTAWIAVAYIVVFATLAPYVMQLWAQGALPASLISAYYALQPVAAVLICFAVLYATPPPHFGLRGPQQTDLAALAVGAGLLLVVRDSARGGGTPAHEKAPLVEQEL